MKNKLNHLVTGSLLLLLSGCWTFDDKTEQGFTIDGVYDGGTYKKDTLCSDVEINNWLTVSTSSNSFDDNPNAGSLWMSIVKKCFPGKGSKGFGRFDFVSPKPNGDWQSTDGFSFAMDTNLSGVMIQPLLSIRKADGTIVKKKSTTGPEFISLQNNYLSQWQSLSYTRDAIADGEEVMAVHIRVFIPHSALIFAGPEAIVSLDDVIPNR